ncbi:MAG: Fe-S cluster assembly ATPase SufC [Oscillospiraceae bacterium]|nr:Fe-S cluster assembly ATPase SufC [Oscillospiraceae bacterium]
MALLTINNLSVEIEEKELLHGVSMEVGSGETHVLMGPNGAGKSTLGYTVMGSPEYRVTGGSIVFDGADITNETPDKRAKRGIFLSFQNPVEIPGITLSDFLRNALEQVTGQRLKLWDFKKQLKAAMEVLQMDASYAERDLNVGFSGGEKKKAEILQLLMLKPKLAILDETDSGLDVDAVRTVSAGIAAYRESCGGSLLIITHNTKILDALHVDRAHIIADGKIVKEGGAELIAEINENGFEHLTGKDAV